jgi:putative aminopeptidase FrvX
MTETLALDHELLQELLWAYAPAEQENSVRDICRRELKPCADEVWQDEAGNLIGLLRGRQPDDAPPTRLTAHLDELSMLVKRVEPDGRLTVMPLGVMYPANFGLGPVAILGNERALTGVLSLGSEHTTQESPRIWQTKPDAGDKSLDWLHVYVFTGRSADELAQAGVRPGTRVCIDRSKRTVVDLGDYLGSYFMDDRAAVTALLQAARLMAEPRGRPRGGGAPD